MKHLLYKQQVSFKYVSILKYLYIVIDTIHSMDFTTNTQIIFLINVHRYLVKNWLFAIKQQPTNHVFFKDYIFF